MSSKRRSVGAVAAGLATIIVVSNGTDTVLELTGAFPSLAEQQASGFDTPWMLAAALGYRALAAALGGWVTARLAPSRPDRHLLALLAVGTALGLAGAAATPGVLPVWFTAVVLLVTPLCVWAGGRMQRTSPRPADAGPLVSARS